MYDIIVVGSATQDVFLQSSKFASKKDAASETGKSEVLPLGSKLEVEKLALASGGGGTNAAVTFARQGFKTAWIGVLGKDVSGDAIVAELEREGIDTSMHQRHDDDLTAFSAVLVDPSGERTILSYKGEGQHFNLEKLELQKLEARWLYLDSMGGHYEIFEALVNHAVKNNIKIACNPGGKELAHGLEKLKPLLEHLDIFTCNKEEAAELLSTKSQAPRPPCFATRSGQANLKQVTNELQKITNGIVAVTDGPNSVTVVDQKGTEYTAGVPDSPIVERTGAGDAFASGFAAEYIRNVGTSIGTSGVKEVPTPDVQKSDVQKSAIIKAIQFGTANASSVVTQFGAKAGILKKGDNGQWPLVHVVKR